MNRTFFKMLPACVLVVCGALSASSQNLQSDTDLRQSVFDNTVANYLTAIGDQSRLYNGPEYNFYDAVIKGNAYFGDVNNFTPGAVEYDGFPYKNVPMLYDINKDLVAILLPNKSAKISLLSERVQSFDWLGHHFVYINTDTLKNDKGVTAGFYDQLYQGKTSILVKRSKSIQNASNSTGSIETYFNATKNIYVKKSGNYTSVSSEGDLLSVFKDKKKELKQYIGTNQIKFKDDQEQAMMKVAAYYDQITL
ncbi:hypothetical protein [Mucilaginibacter sp.]|uniref:hypothetical protein n=1 Tax=Mucilaginibacter sp. TaxID=1882438 RepID=UPI0035BBF4DB